MLINVKEVADKVIKLNLGGRSKLLMLPIHMPSDMLPMSYFFDSAVKGQMNKGYYGYAMYRLRKAFKTDESLALVWYILRFYEQEGEDITTNSDIWNSINNLDNLRTLLNNY